MRKSKYYIFIHYYNMIYICTLLVFAFILINNAVIISLLLLLLTVIIAIYRIILTNSIWVSYRLVLILAGALIILFIYRSSLSPNNQIKLPPIRVIRKVLIFSLIFSQSIEIINLNINISQINNINLFIIILSINYLLIAIFIITLIIKVIKGPLRSIK